MLGSDTGLDRWTAAIIIAAGLGLLRAWTHGRRYATSTRPAGILLAGLGATTLLVAATAELWPESDGGAIHRWFERLPYGMIQNSPDQAAVAAAVIVCWSRRETQSFA